MNNRKNEYIELENKLYNKYNEIKRYIIFKKVPHDDVEDVAHDVIVTAGSHLHQLRDPDRFDAWIYTITKNQIAAYWKQKMRRGEKETAYDSGEEDLNFQYYIPKVMECPGEVLGDKDLFEMIRSFKEPIPYIFELHFFRGYTLKEVAKILGINYNTVKTMENRALKKLKEILTKDEGAEK